MLGTPIGHSRYVGQTTQTMPAPRHSVSDHAIRKMLQGEIGTNTAIPQPNPNNLHFVYLPSGQHGLRQGGGNPERFRQHGAGELHL